MTEKLTLRNAGGTAIQEFTFTQEQLDEGDDFFTVVEWIQSNPDKANGLVGRSEFHELILLYLGGGKSRNFKRAWNIDADGRQPLPDGGAEVVREWVEAIIERADWAAVE